MEFPHDETGDVLRGLYEAGVDLSAKHDIDFYHLFPDKARADQMRQRLIGLKIEAFVDENEEEGGFDCACVVRMVPTHAGITDMENRLGAIAEECGGKADGWGMMQG